jgi:hypothetical protein
MELDPGKKTPGTEPVAPHVQAPEHVTVMVRPLGEHGLTCEPNIAEIRHHGWVTWNVSELPIAAGGSVEIEFTDVLNDKKGPCPQDPADNHNPERAKYKCKKGHQGEHPIHTAPEDQCTNPEKPGYWKYKVTVFDAAGQQVRFADPGVKIIEGPRPGGGKGH